MTNNNSKSGIQVISRAAAILRALRGSQAGMSLGQIAARVDLPRSTVQRIAGALVDEGLLITASQGRGLRLGPEMSTFAEETQFNIVEHCRLYLTELTQKTGETADLSALRGAGMAFLDQVPGTHRLTTLSKVGEVFPMTTTANGLSCLSILPEAEAITLIKAEWARTGNDGNLSKLIYRLEEIRENGLAFDIDEHSTGISAVGFAFKDWNDIPHAISVPMPSTRFLGMRATVAKELLQVKSEVTKMFERT